MSFQAAVGQLQEVVGSDHEYMSQATAWWQEIAPDRELFGADGLAAVSLPAESSGVSDDVTPEATGVDFDLGFPDPDAEVGSQSGIVDFDLGLEGGAFGGDDATTGGDLDFDLTTISGEVSGDIGSESVGLDLDLDSLTNVGDDNIDFSSGSALDFDLDTLGGRHAEGEARKAAELLHQTGGGDEGSLIERATGGSSSLDFRLRFVERR